mmetsp:Transcript_8008/g.18744  ORF Transcript_8008/g.18744 Transcript_8008/m.18744 type:complete len:82 (-) Transcript_8008:19-264(-)
MLYSYRYFILFFFFRTAVAHIFILLFHANSSYADMFGQKISCAPLSTRPIARAESSLKKPRKKSHQSKQCLILIQLDTMPN